MNKIFLIFSIFLVSSCGKREKKEEKQAFAVKTVHVIKRDALIFLDAIGHVDPILSAEVRSQVTGNLIEMHFKEGDYVKENDLLFTIDPRPFQADLAKAQAVYDENRANLKIAREKVQRYSPLAKKEYISKLSYDELTTDVERLKATSREKRAEIVGAKINLDYCYITSPISGKTGILKITKGNLISAEDILPLITINQIAPIYVTFSIPEKELYKVLRYQKENNLKVRAAFEDPNKDFLEGSLEVIDSSVNTKTSMIKLRAIFDNDEKILWPGEFVKTRLILTIQKDALLIPSQAIQITDKGPVVFLVKRDNTVHIQPIVLGQQEDDMMIIEKGITFSDEVIIEGQLNLSEGAKIEKS